MIKKLRSRWRSCQQASQLRIGSNANNASASATPPTHLFGRPQAALLRVEQHRQPRVGVLHLRRAGRRVQAQYCVVIQWHEWRLKHVIGPGLHVRAAYQLRQGLQVGGRGAVRADGDERVGAALLCEWNSVAC